MRKFNKKKLILLIDDYNEAIADKEDFSIKADEIKRYIDDKYSGNSYEFKSVLIVHVLFCLEKKREIDRRIFL